MEGTGELLNVRAERRAMANVNGLPWPLLIIVVTVLVFTAGSAPVSAVEDEMVPEWWPGMHFFVSVPGKTLDTNTRALLEEIRPGGIVLLRQNVGDADQVRRLISDIKKAVGYGEGLADWPLIAVDQEGGKVNRLRLADAPSARDVGHRNDSAEAARLGRYYAEESLRRNIPIILAPVLDVSPAGSQGPLGDRVFSDDADSVAKLGMAFARGVLRAGAIPVLKHFPGHGAAEADSHFGLAKVTHRNDELIETLYPFYSACEARLPAMMVGHLVFPELDHENVPATFSEPILRGMVRDRWKYSGLLMSDDMNMGGAMSRGPQSCMEALIAGNDVVILLDSKPNELRKSVRAVARAAESGQWLKVDVHASIRRLEDIRHWIRLSAPLQTSASSNDQTGPTRREALYRSVPNVRPTETAEPIVESPMGRDFTYYHIVQSGDTVGGLARKYGLTVDSIASWNNLTDVAKILVGQKLRVGYESSPGKTTPNDQEMR